MSFLLKGILVIWDLRNFFKKSWNLIHSFFHLLFSKILNFSPLFSSHFRPHPSPRRQPKISSNLPWNHLTMLHMSFQRWIKQEQSLNFILPPTHSQNCPLPLLVQFITFTPIHRKFITQEWIKTRSYWKRKDQGQWLEFWILAQASQEEISK